MSPAAFADYVVHYLLGTRPLDFNTLRELYHTTASEDIPAWLRAIALLQDAEDGTSMRRAIGSSNSQTVGDIMHSPVEFQMAVLGWRRVPLTYIRFHDTAVRNTSLAASKRGVVYKLDGHSIFTRMNGADAQWKQVVEAVLHYASTTDGYNVVVIPSILFERVDSKSDGWAVTKWTSEDAKKD